METSIEFENNLVKTSINDALAIFEFKKDAFSMITDVDEGYKLLDWLNVVKMDNSIKGVLIHGNPKLFCEAPYEIFLSKIRHDDLCYSSLRKIKSMNFDLRKKQITILNNFTRNILKFPKMIIAFFSGCVVTPFIGSVLATDFKLATNQASFSFAHKKYGLHPTGALPFFLTQSLGISKAKNLLFTKDQLNSEELLSLGLIDIIISPKDPKEIIEYSRRIVEDKSESFTSTKQLTNKILYEDYEKFMELESQMYF